MARYGGDGFCKIRPVLTIEKGTGIRVSIIWIQFAELDKQSGDIPHSCHDTLAHLIFLVDLDLLAP